MIRREEGRKDNSFAIQMLLITIACFLAYFPLTVSSSHNITAFALSYHYGFIARGLMGTFLEFLAGIFGTWIYSGRTVYWICLIAYGIYGILLYYLMKQMYVTGNKSTYRFLTVIIPFFMLFFVTESNFGRLDLFLMIMSLMACILLFKGGWGVLFVPLLCGVGMLIHDGYIFTAFHFVAAFMVFRIRQVWNHKEERRRYIVVFLLSCAICIGLFLWFECVRPKYPQTADAVEEAAVLASHLNENGDEVYMSLLRRVLLGEPLHEEDTDFRTFIHISVIVFIVLFLPVWLFAFRILRRLWTKVSDRRWMVFFCLGGLTLLPEFMFNCDYGRWIFSLIAYYLMIVILFTAAGEQFIMESILEELEFLDDKGWGMFLAVYFILFLPMFDVGITRQDTNLTNYLNYYVFDMFGK